MPALSHLIVIPAAFTATLWTSSLFRHDDLVDLQDGEHRLDAKAESPPFCVFVVEDSFLSGIADKRVRLHINTYKLLAFLVCSIHRSDDIDVATPRVVCQNLGHNFQGLCKLQDCILLQ